MLKFGSFYFFNPTRKCHQQKQKKVFLGTLGILWKESIQKPEDAQFLR